MGWFSLFPSLSLTPSQEEEPKSTGKATKRSEGRKERERSSLRPASAPRHLPQHSNLPALALPSHLLNLQVSRFLCGSLQLSGFEANPLHFTPLPSNPIQFNPCLVLLALSHCRILFFNYVVQLQVLPHSCAPSIPVCWAPPILSSRGAFGCAQGWSREGIRLLLVLLPTGCPNLGIQSAGERRRRSRHSLGDLVWVWVWVRLWSIQAGWIYGGWVSVVGRWILVGWHCDSQAEEEDDELRGKRFSGESITHQCIHKHTERHIHLEYKLYCGTDSSLSHS